MSWKFSNDLPIYTQLVEKIKSMIFSGFYSPGEKLPSVRDLSIEAGVNPNTMQKAMLELERLELITTQRTVGRFITENKELINCLNFELSDNIINDFCKKISTVGLSKDEIIKLITERLEESL